MRVKVHFKESSGFKAIFLDNPNDKLTPIFNESVIVERITGDVYNGPYNIIPRLDKQILQTKNKSLIDNISVEEIPTYEVSNDAGGETFILVKGDK